jgi:hypothetical protein
VRQGAGSERQQGNRVVLTNSRGCRVLKIIKIKARLCALHLPFYSHERFVKWQFSGRSDFHGESAGNFSSPTQLRRIEWLGATMNPNGKEI